MRIQDFVDPLENRFSDFFFWYIRVEKKRLNEIKILLFFQKKCVAADAEG